MAIRHMWQVANGKWVGQRCSKGFNIIGLKKVLF